MEYFQWRKWTLYAMSLLQCSTSNILGCHWDVITMYLNNVLANVYDIFNIFGNIFVVSKNIYDAILHFKNPFADFLIRFYRAINIAFNVDPPKNYKYHLRIFSAYAWPKYRSVHENENKDIFLLEMYKRLSCKPIIRYVRRLPSKRNNQTVASSIIKPKTTSRSKNKISKNDKNACHDHPIKSTFYIVWVKYLKMV